MAWNLANLLSCFQAQRISKSRPSHFDRDQATLSISVHRAVLDMAETASAYVYG